MPLPPHLDVAAYEKYHVQGYPMAEIAAEQNRTLLKIQRGIARVQRWKDKENAVSSGAGKESPGAKGLAITIAVERLQHSWHESMGAWYRSQQPKETFKAATHEKTGQRAEHIKRMRVGDLRFLELARRLVREMVSLQATGEVAANEQVEEQLPDVATLTVNERRDKANSIVAPHGERRPSDADVGTANWDSRSGLPPADAAAAVLLPAPRQRAAKTVP
jgi:hypothetical protein